MPLCASPYVLSVNVSHVARFVEHLKRDNGSLCLAFACYVIETQLLFTMTTWIGRMEAAEVKSPCIRYHDTPFFVLVVINFSARR